MSEDALWSIQEARDRILGKTDDAITALTRLTTKGWTPNDRAPFQQAYYILRKHHDKLGHILDDSQ